MLLKPGLYRHYKGKDYFVFLVANHSETNEPYVVYRYLYDDYGWSVRPLDLFLETIEVAGETIPRFRCVREIDQEEMANYLMTVADIKNRD
jgi:hypothetical protein